MQINLIKPADLTLEQLALWSHWQTTQASLESPYFRPEFTQAVAAVRQDVEIAVLTETGQTVGFFPFQRGTLNLGKPVGGKLSDYHGLIAAPGIAVDPTALLQKCGLAGWDFDHLPISQASFLPFSTERGRSPQLDVRGGLEGFNKLRKAAGSDVIPKIRDRKSVV